MQKNTELKINCNYAIKHNRKQQKKIGNIKYMSKCGKIDLYFKASYHIVQNNNSQQSYIKKNLNKNRISEKD